MNLFIITEKIAKHPDKIQYCYKSFLIIIAIFIELALISYFMKVSLQFPFLFVKMKILATQNFKDTLTLIIATLATILSIVFALSQFIISNIVDKYSIQMIEKYEKTPETALFRVNILIIAITFFLLVIPNLKTSFPLFYIMGIIFSIYLFIISFIFLMEFIQYMFTIINPSKFSDTQKKQVINAIISQNEEDVRQGIRSMGDIAIKLMRKGEEKVGLKYINHFKDIFLEFMKLREKYPNKYKIEVFKPYENKENKNNVFKYIQDEYLRIFKECLAKEQDVLSQKVTDNLFEIMNVILYAK
jgi:hypothetical protein